MGLFGNLIKSISESSEKCPWCGSSMDGDGERFECPNCTGGVFFTEDGKIVDLSILPIGVNSETVYISNNFDYLRKCRNISKTKRR